MVKRIIAIEGSNSGRDVILLILRIAIAALMIGGHGMGKLQQLMGGDQIQFISFLGMGAGLSLVLAVFAEVICSLLILVGLGTRAAAVPLMITMLVAVFYYHAADPFVKQELGLLYLLVYGVLMVAGSGKYSADYLVTRKVASV